MVNIVVKFMGVAISKFSRRGREAVNKILVYLPLWPRGRNP